MKKLKKIWNNNRILCLFLLVTFTFVIVFLSMLLPMYSKSGDKYGNRLVGIEDVKLDKDISNDIKSILKENESVEDVITKLKGKTYNILIYLKDDTDVNSVVSSAEGLTEFFTDDELNFYDIQIFITSTINNSEDEKIDKTIVGYRNSSKESFSWTNNR